MLKAERGKLFNRDQNHDETAKKSYHCSFSKYRVLLFAYLEEMVGVERRSELWVNFSLIDLGLAYDRDQTVEETAQQMLGQDEKPKATVVYHKN